MPMTYRIPILYILNSRNSEKRLFMLLRNINSQFDIIYLHEYYEQSRVEFRPE